jgi:hypothetical protein
MSNLSEVLAELHNIVANNSKYTTWTVSSPHLVMLWERAQELERDACLAKADIALLGAEKALRNRVLKAMRTREKADD